MTTLASDKARTYEIGDRSDYPMIAADIIYEGAAVGVVEASGHARPLQGGDKFVGFAIAKVNNSSGSATDKNVTVKRHGQIQLAVSGAVITDVGQPVYATDDDTFVFLPTGGTFIGFVKRFVSAGTVIVEFDVDRFVDPYGGGVYETITGAKTLDAEDNGKTFFVTADGAVVTLPAAAIGVNFTIVNAGAFGAVGFSLDPAATDLIYAPDVTAADDKDLTNTKATAQRGDKAVVRLHDADGYAVTELVGTWAREA